MFLRIIFQYLKDLDVEEGIPEIKTRTDSWQMPRSRFLNQCKELLSRLEGSEFPNTAHVGVYVE